MKDIKVYIFIASILLILYLTAQYNRPKAIDWAETLTNNDKMPYGTYVLYNRINDIFPDAQVKPYRQPVYNVINDHAIKNSAYIIICNSINLNPYDYSKLSQFVKNGNDVFIAASDFGAIFRKNLKIETASELNPAGTLFLNKQLDTNYTYWAKKGVNNVYFSKLDTANAIVLSKNNLGHSDFIKYCIGKGALYLNADPLMFSNYNILNKQGAAYVSFALSYIKNDKILLWDEFYTMGREGDDNTMRVFLRYKELKWAFYSAFFSLLLFVLYDMKRRQRVIPVIEPLKNATLDFVTVVGQVYYEKHNNANIAHKKILYLLTYLRDGHQLKTNKLNEEFIDKLTAKLGIERKFAQELVNYIKYVSVQEHVNDNELIKLNKLIEQFYTPLR